LIEFFVFKDEKIKFIKRHLGIMSPFNAQEERQQARDFVLQYLKDDGVFLTRLLSINSSDLVVTEIINQLWLRFKTANRLYSTVNTQRIRSTIEENNQRPSRIPSAYVNHQQYSKIDKTISKDTDV